MNYFMRIRDVVYNNSFQTEVIFLAIYFIIKSTSRALRWELARTKSIISYIYSYISISHWKCRNRFDEWELLRIIEWEVIQRAMALIAICILMRRWPISADVNYASRYYSEFVSILLCHWIHVFYTVEMYVYHWRIIKLVHLISLEYF